MQSYRGLNALVTGASSGIGLAIAEKLAQAGAHLVLSARNQAKLATIAARLSREYAVRVEIVALDLSEVGAAQHLFEQSLALDMPIDLLINNAGFGYWGEFGDGDPAAYRQMLQLNIAALTELCQLYLPAMRSRNRGGIINVASTAALVPVPYATAYAASKAYVLSLSEGLYGELLNSNVHVMALCPGATETGFAAVAGQDLLNFKTSSSVETPDAVAQTALKAFLQGRSHVVSGNNRSVSWLPRILPRASVTRLVGQIWKKNIGLENV